MNISELCNPFVVVAQRTTPLTDAARLMREHHVGSLVVVDETGKGRVPGRHPDRPRHRRGRGRGRGGPAHADRGRGDERAISPRCAPGDSAEAALRLMRRRGIRRVPVVSEAGTLTGIVTLDDLLEKVAEQLSDAVRAITSEQVHETRARR